MTGAEEGHILGEPTRDTWERMVAEVKAAQVELTPAQAALINEAGTSLWAHMNAPGRKWALMTPEDIRRVLDTPTGGPPYAVHPDDYEAMTTGQAPDLTQWLIDRIYCPRCRRAVRSAEDVADQMTGAQPVNPAAPLGQQFWEAHVTVLACTAAGHPSVTHDLTPSRLDPPPDEDQAQP